MSGPFEFIKSINSGKRLELDNSYNQFLTNRALSYHLDTLSIACYANENHQMSDQMHYDLMLSLVSPKNRFSKWPKPEKHSDARVLSLVFGISLRHAYEYVNFYTKEEISELRDQLEENE